MAVSVRSKSPRKFRQAADLSGTLLHDGRPLPIVAVDDGSALVCVVREPSTYLAAQSFALGTSISEHRYEMTFEKEDRLRIIWPVPRSVPEAAGATLYDRSRDFTRKDGAMLWLLTGIAYPKPSGQQLRLADAAAVAGLEASASGSRRSVVLVLGDKNSDGSRDAPAVVRRYLAAIRVPLFVWSLKNPVTQPLARD